MSQNRRRNRNNRAKGNNQANSGQRKGNTGAQGTRRKSEPSVDPVEFWGDAGRLPDPISAVQGVPDVRALVTSLGRVPIPGQETAAEHWFSLVYERSAVLAGALAAAGEIDGDRADPDDET